MNLNDFALIELNEAFAAQVIAVDRLMPMNREILNVNGGSIALRTSDRMYWGTHYNNFAS